MKHHIRAGLIVTGLLALLLSAGCASQNTPNRARPAAAVPTHDPGRYVLMPRGDSALLATLKQRLAARGWQFTPYTADMTRGIDDYRAMAGRARYRLTLQATNIGACETGQTSYRYRLALIENRTGDVPITMSGADCMPVIDTGFTRALQRGGISPSGRGPAAG